MTTQSKSMKVRPEITVVIPAYNEEKLIAKTLASIRAQSFKNFEILVIDNNSTDNTVEVAKYYKAKVIREKQQGYVFALNRGLKEAQGDIIAVTDADSLPERDWLKQIALSMKPENVIALTGLAKFDIQSKIARILANNAYMIFTHINFFLRKPHINGFNLAVKKRYVDQIGAINPAYQIGADVHLGLSLKQYGKITFAKNAVVLTSTRRWQKQATKSLFKYSATYLFVVWFRRPLQAKLVAIR